MDHRLHEGDRIMPREEGEARADHWLAQDMAGLLGQIPPPAPPPAPCPDPGCDLPCHPLDPKNDVASWLSASRPGRKLHFIRPRAARINMGIFAVQHLRIYPDWLNSMQLENNA